MEPLRHSLAILALSGVAVLGTPAGAAHAATGCAALPDPPADAALARVALPVAAAVAGDAATAPPVVAVATAQPPPDGAAPAVVAAAVPSAAPREAPPAPDAPRAGAPRELRISLPVEIEVHGRLLTGISADERDAWDRTFGVSSARLGIEARFAGVKTVVEADLASTPMVEDAYVRLDGPGETRLLAGRFKAPFSERRTESSWRLPLVDRGLVDRFLVKRNGLGGRRLGAAGALRLWRGRVDASAGVFAGDPDALEAGSDAGEDLAARVALRRWDALELGASGYRAGAGTGPGAAPVRHAAGAFANVDLGAVEASLEAFTGRVAEGAFTAGTALVAWGLRVGAGGRLRVTPVAGAEALELGGAGGGIGYGAIAGAVISWTEGLKVKLQGEWARRPGDATPASTISAEVGTRF